MHEMYKRESAESLGKGSCAHGRETAVSVNRSRILHNWDDPVTPQSALQWSIAALVHEMSHRTRRTWTALDPEAPFDAISVDVQPVGNEGAAKYQRLVLGPLADVLVEALAARGWTALAYLPIPDRIAGVTVHSPVNGLAVRGLYIYNLETDDASVQVSIAGAVVA